MLLRINIYWGAKVCGNNCRGQITKYKIELFEFQSNAHANTLL
jgi:hypothetical protein